MPSPVDLNLSYAKLETVAADTTAQLMRCPDCMKTDRTRPLGCGFGRCERCLATFRLDWQRRKR
jgi:hypothetical protein